MFRAEVSMRALILVGISVVALGCGQDQPGEAASSLNVAADKTCGDGHSKKCKNGLVRCNCDCVDVTTDVGNCGACGVGCVPPTGGTVSCSAGVCVASCPAGQAVCGGTCIPVGSDNNNCGACGNVCGAGQTCSNGSCVFVCPPGMYFDTG